MTKKNDDPADEHQSKTLPPPASGDAYSAETAVREVPPDILNSIRRARQAGQIETPGLMDLVKSISPKALAPAPLPRLNAPDEDLDEVDDQARTRLRSGPRAPIRSSPAIVSGIAAPGEAQDPAQPSEPPSLLADDPASSHLDEKRRQSVLRRRVALLAIGGALLLFIAMLVAYHYSGVHSPALPPAR